MAKFLPVHAPSFMREALRHRILTKEEERALFETVKRGTPSDDPGAPKPSKKQIREAEAAKQVLALHNLKFVLRYATMFGRLLRGRALDVDDLFQEGITGEMIAVGRFDVERGTRHSTYSGHWIRHAITRAVHDLDLTVRIPVHALESLGKMRRVYAKYELLHGREPTAEEIAHETGLKSETVKKLMKVVLQEPSSLDQPVTTNGRGANDERNTFKDLVEDPNPDPERALDQDRTKAFVRSMLAELAQPHRFIIEQRCLNDENPTLNEVASMLHERGITDDCLSRERIRQLQAEAMDQLRHIALKRERACEARIANDGKAKRVPAKPAKAPPEEPEAPVSEVIAKPTESRAGRSAEPPAEDGAPKTPGLRVVSNGSDEPRRSPNKCPPLLLELIEGLEEPHRSVITCLRVDEPRQSVTNVSRALSIQTQTPYSRCMVIRLHREALAILRKRAPEGTDLSYLA